MFIPATLSAAANRFVKSQPADRNPRFPRKDYAGAVHVSGALLRYSSTTPATDRPEKR